MTHHRLLGCLLLGAGLVSGLAADAVPEKQQGLESQYGLSLLPEPRIVRVEGEDFRLTPATVIFADKTSESSPALASLREGIHEIAKLRLTVTGSEPKANGIVLRLVPETALKMIPDGNPKREGYRLKVTGRRVTIEAAHVAGLFYGVQTLLQLLDNGQGVARGMAVVDWPEMEFRAIHVDLWYHLDRPWYYKHLFRQLARYKINAVVFEFEDKFGYTSHPALAAPNALTHEQVRELVREAKRYFIEIVPLVQTLGHVSFIAKHPEFAPLREVPYSNWQLCPLKKGTFPLIGDMINEVLDTVQPAKYFHIGGDEARELGRGAECRRKWGDRAPVESYKLWLNFVCDVLKKRGKTAIVWDDMFLKYFSDADMAKLPDNLIYMRWNYATGDFPEKEKKILKLGYPVWIATSSQTMTPIFPDQKDRLDNNADFIPSAAALDIKAVLNTAWDDEGVHPETYWLGFLASAEYSWSPAKPTKAEYRNKFFRLFYGPRATGMGEVYDTLSRRKFLRRESGWTKQFEALDLPPLPGEKFQVQSSWAQQHAALVAEAEARRPRYAAAVDALKENLARDTRNRFNQEVLLLCARLDLHFTDLILAINEINDNLLAARADHAAGNDVSAVDRYQRIGRIIDDLRYRKERLFADTVRIWEKSTYPKDFRDIPGGRERALHQIGRDFYYGNKTMDLSYIFEVEEKLGLFAWQQSLYGKLVDFLRGDHPW